jgi:hypothetical protein
MKGATMVATLERLGILPSFSRPSVSDDNPYSEALFRTLKYRPEYPDQPFDDVAAARAWVATFVRWYNTEHLHSGIRFVTPEDRHSGREAAILAGRRALYANARAARPERWSRGPRCWTPVERVYLNPERPTTPPPVTAPTPVAAAAPPPAPSASATGRRQPPAPRGRADQKNHCAKIPTTTILTFTARMVRRCSRVGRSWPQDRVRDRVLGAEHQGTRRGAKAHQAHGRTIAGGG